MTIVAAERMVSLEDAIAQQINLGHKDPLTIARNLANLHGGDWVAEQLASHWEEILAEIARQMLGNQRRASVESLGDAARSDRKLTKREVVLTSVFIPKKGYIALGDATADDLLEAADYRRRLANGLIRWADWFDAVREELRVQGVSRVRDLRGHLPGLPKADQIEPA